MGTFTGVCDAEASRQALISVWKLSGWNGRAVVWDARKSRIQVTTADVQAVAKFILARQPARPPARVAFVTLDDVGFGLLRMLEVYREHPATETRVVRDFDEALAWAAEVSASNSPAA